MAEDQPSRRHLRHRLVADATRTRRPARPSGRRRAAPAIAVLAVVAVVAVGCGGSGEGASADAPAPARLDFPAVEGRGLEQIAADVGLTDQLVASPAGRVFRVGRNRFGFGLFTVGREQIADTDVAVYAARGANGKARGPFPASGESLATEPTFVAQTTATDPDAITFIYTSQLRLSARGEWRLLAVVRDGDELSATRMPSLEVGRFERIPAPGERAPLIHTPTVADVGDISRIDTRVPHSTMHDVDFADALEEEPIVLLFATPALCQSRVCGPVVDVTEQVKRDYADEDVAFIHMEVYRDNNPNKGLRPQLKAFGLPSEPWLFVIDARGRVSTAIEGGFGVEELRHAVERVLPG